MNIVSWESTVSNPNGVHCRVAERLIKVVDEHEAIVQIIDRGPPIDCTSILELLSLALVQGSRVRFTAQGPDADRVVVAVDQVLSESEPVQDASVRVQQQEASKE
ncbi:MAG: HPr family phosphocarrier protein [Candidatus Electrothrix sp. GM3_4]|nr:HPr family phosphocarrier protein [Candidatus Electrothrix sp. GM3_4]